MWRRSGCCAYWGVATLEVSVAMLEYVVVRNVAKAVLLLRLNCSTGWGVAQGGVWRSVECCARWNVAQGGMWRNVECGAMLNVVQAGIKRKLDSGADWN